MARGLLRFNEPDRLLDCRTIIFSRSAPNCGGSDQPADRIFLHTPWADRRTMAAVPHHADLLQAMLAYDLIGFRPMRTVSNFEDYVQIELGLRRVNGTVTSSRG